MARFIYETIQLFILDFMTDASTLQKLFVKITLNCTNLLRNENNNKPRRNGQNEEMNVHKTMAQTQKH